MQSTPKRFLFGMDYAEGKQTPTGIIQIINKFLVIYCTVLCDRHQFLSFTFLRVHRLNKVLLK